MKKSLILLIIFALTLPLFFCSEAAEKNVNLCILHTNDTHGHPVKFKYEDAMWGGLPVRASLINAIRAEQKNLILIDCGDFNTGRPESNFFNAEPDITGFNYCGYNVMIPGNHEFDHSPEFLKNQIKSLNAEFISSNISTRDNKQVEGTKKFIITEINKLKVGIIGLTTCETATIANPEFTKELVFKNEIESAREIIKQIKNKTDIIIAVTHMGIDMKTKEGSILLAEEAEGLDLIIDGHSHTLTEKPLYVKNRNTGKSVPIISAQSWGLYLGRINIKFNSSGIQEIDYSPLKLKLSEDNGFYIKYKEKKIYEDKFLLTKLEPYLKKVEKTLSRKIGFSPRGLSHLSLRHKETILGNFITDCLYTYTKKFNADFAFMNSGSIREALPKGVITRKTIYEILPFDNTVIIFTLTPEQIKQFLNFTASVKPGDGGFPNFSGNVTAYLDRKNLKDSFLLIDNKKLESGRKYKLAINSYTAAGGDNYKILKEFSDFYDTSIPLKSAIIESIEKYSIPLPAKTGRIKTIKD